MPTYYAHSAENRPQSDWQTLKSHAENVAALADQRKTAAVSAS